MPNGVIEGFALVWGSAPQRSLFGFDPVKTIGVAAASQKRGYAEQKLKDQPFH
jgi:hypothetical protein